jgi:hypothetical protein
MRQRPQGSVIFSESMRIIKCVILTTEIHLRFLLSLATVSALVNMKTKAIVLTYDKNRIFTDHMICKYDELWPSHPFIFRVPYQEIEPSQPSNKVEYVKTPADIKSTVLELLKDLDDEELIYWCIDDKYPHYLDVNLIEKMLPWIFNRSRVDPDASGFLLCRCRGLLRRKRLTGKRIVKFFGWQFLERANYSQIWIHQFLKVKVLRHLFEAFPDKIEEAKQMDNLIKHKVQKPISQRLYVIKKNITVFGESCSRGKITKGCRDSLIKSGVSVSEWNDPVEFDLMGKIEEV